MARRRATKTGGRPPTAGVIAGDYALCVGTPDRPTPEGWRWVALTDVARLETGHTPSRRHPEYWGGDIPWIGIKDATENHGRVILDTHQHTNARGIDNSSARVLPANTVCLSRTASVGYVVIMGRPMATSQDFVNWVCSDRLDWRFLKYVLLAERDAFMRFASGTTHQTIYFPEVKAFHLCIPPLAEQRRIATVLGALDDKIELNRRMCETLEATARALFQSWLVDFDPVRAKAENRDAGLPSDLAAEFPGRFIVTDHGDLPEGWHWGSLSTFAQLNPEVWNRGTRPSVLRYVDLGAAKWGRMGDPTVYVAEGAPSRAQRVLRPGDTIVGTVRPGNGSYTFVSEQGLTGSTGFAVLRPIEEANAALIYLAATTRENIDRLARLADGGAYPAVLPEVVLNTRVARAKAGVLRRFSDTANPILSRVASLQHESRALRAVRDAFLPKLMSGEIRLRDAERIAGAVV